MTKKEMNELADMIVDKLLTTYIREQATWYTTSTMDDIYNTFKQKPKKKTKKAETESELLGQLAKLMTQLNYHQELEEYEACAEIKKFKSQVNDLVNDPLFIRLGELLAEKRKLQQIEDEKNKTK